VGGDTEAVFWGCTVVLCTFGAAEAPPQKKPAVPTANKSANERKYFIEYDVSYAAEEQPYF
jgi:hypothetical protein